MKCICEESYCTGCQSCVMKCSTDNIIMREHISGFKYAHIVNNEQCAQCGFICPQLKDNLNTSRMPKAYAFQIKDEDVLLESTSGGLFYAISEVIFGMGGVVFGAAYDDNLCVKHIVVTTISDLWKLHGSKYIQSDVTDIYISVKQYLDNDVKVLFSGLPCQIAGLLSYLGKEYSGLYTMDLICSGVPSAKLFRSYIDMLQMQKQIKIVDYKFRDKHKNGCSHTVVMKYIDRCGRMKEDTITERDQVSYYVAFGKENCFMDACYHCKYNSIARIGDFTAGGFWGIGRTSIVLDEYKGVSLLLVNTNKAAQMVEKLEEHAYIVETSIEEAAIGNRALIHHTPDSAQRHNLWRDLEKMGYFRTSRIYFKSASPVYIRLRKIYFKMLRIAKSLYIVFRRKINQGKKV